MLIYIGRNIGEIDNLAYRSKSPKEVVGVFAGDY
jgi:hypothetical protein